MLLKITGRNSKTKISLRQFRACLLIWNCNTLQFLCYANSKTLNQQKWKDLTGSQSWLCHRGCSVFSPLNSEFPTGMPMGYSCANMVTPWPLGQHWGSVLPVASSFYPSVFYKDYHLLKENPSHWPWRRNEHTLPKRSMHRQRFKKWELRGREGGLYLLIQVCHLKPPVPKSTVGGRAWSHATLGEASPDHLLGQRTSRKPDLCGKRHWGLAKWKPSTILSSRCSLSLSAASNGLCPWNSTLGLKR